MSLFDNFKQDRVVKRFAVDSLAHSIFYGVIGGIIALALGIEPQIYITMSILGTAINFLSGGLFGKFLDFVRRVTNV